ncbi:MAG: leucine-rich repeat domain-containing protein [Proteobacteria bacterium]|nr:MAG: leucine-rich repeat domain-containing protein [Pseudomonadota bacterium]
MKLKVIFVFLILPTLFSCKTLNNRFNELALDCGASEVSNDSNQYFAIEGQQGFSEVDVSLFEISSGKPLPLEFSITKKSCIKILRGAKSSPRELVIVFRNQSAAKFVLPVSLKQSRKIFLESCHSYCLIFPMCGKFTEADASDVSKKVFHIATQSKEGLDAIVDDGSKISTVKINDAGCFSLPKDAGGTIKIRNERGSFLEADLTKLIQSTASEQVSNITLRDPLSVEEIRCKEKKKSHFLDNGKCFAKSFKEYCEDENKTIGVVILSSYFLNADCADIDLVLKNKTNLIFPSKSFNNPEIFSNLPNLRELNISGNYITSLENLIEVPNLEKVILFANKVPFDISSLSSIPSLRKIDITSSPITGIQRLSQLPNIEEIFVNTRDFSIFEKMNHLKSVEISGFDVIDVSKIPDLPYLEKLKFSNGSSIANIGALKKFKNLKELYFNGDLDPEDEFPDLKLDKFEISFGTNIDFSKLKNLQHVKNMEMKIVDFENYSKFPTFPNLETLDLYVDDSFPKTDLKFLTNFPNVKDLSLGYVSDSLADMPELNKLKRLSFTSTGYTSFKGLENLKNLEVLEISDTSQGVDFETLPPLQNLIEFNSTYHLVYKDSISWMSKFQKLKKLKINLNYTELLKASDFPEDLEDLSLESSHLEDINFLKDMPKLVSLDLRLKGNHSFSYHDFDLPYIKRAKIELHHTYYQAFPTFSNVEHLEIYSRGAELGDVNPAGPRFPRVKTLFYQDPTEDLTMLNDFKQLESLNLDTRVIQLSSIPKLNKLRNLILNDPDLEGLNGIENLPNIENLEFVATNRLTSLEGLTVLKNLKAIQGSTNLREQFGKGINCPESIDVSVGLRKYCLDTQKSFAPSFGPDPRGF